MCAGLKVMPTWKFCCCSAATELAAPPLETLTDPTLETGADWPLLVAPLPACPLGVNWEGVVTEVLEGGTETGGELLLAEIGVCWMMGMAPGCGW